MSAAAPVPRRHALLIGIDRYPHFDAREQLSGCRRDVEAMAALLENGYGFDRLTTLLDEEATRVGILAAMETLAAAADHDDLVVFYYSGHGSQMIDREGDDPDGFDETLVPYDSGRETHENRDITDDEIYLWLLRLAARTPYVTVIVDACHSATIVRDGFGPRARHLPPDRRSKRDLPPSPIDRQSRGLLASARSSKWLPAGERYTLIAACRDDETAFEVPVGSHSRGALTFFLVQELARAATDATYRDIFEKLDARFASLGWGEQHPQLEGARDRRIFGTRKIEPMRFFSVLDRPDRATAVVGAGAAFGWTQGSELAVYLPGTRKMGAEAVALGKLELTEIGAVTSRARVTEESVADGIVRGARVVEIARDYGEMRLAVELVDRSSRADAAMELARRLEGSRLLRAVEKGERGAVRVYLLGPRRSVKDGDPVPQLGPVDEPTWVVVGGGGRLICPPLPVDALAAAGKLQDILETRARYQMVLDLDAHDPDSRLRHKIRAQLMRSDESGIWRLIQPGAGGLLTCAPGDLLGLVVHNDSDQEVYIHILDLGLSGAIDVLYPVAGSQEPVRPDGHVEIGMRQGELPFEVFLPEGYPYEPGLAADAGSEHLKIFATSHPADFTPLRQRDYDRAFAPGTSDGDSHLGGLLHRALMGSADRGAYRHPDGRVEDWATTLLSFRVSAASRGAKRF